MSGLHFIIFIQRWIRVTARCDIQKVNTAVDQIVKIGEIIDGYAAGVDI